MRFAYADPPYLGMCGRYGHEHHGGGCWDDVETHRALIERLSAFDGYVLSFHLPSLPTILPMLPDNARVMSWCKRGGNPFPAHPLYAWEPVAIVGGNTKGGHRGYTPHDWLVTTVDREFFGQKPQAFTMWILDCLGVSEDDEFTDLFYGSGAVTKAYESWRTQLRMFA